MISENSSPAFFITNNLSNQGNNTRYNILIYFSCRLRATTGTRLRAEHYMKWWFHHFDIILHLEYNNH